MTVREDIVLNLPMQKAEVNSLIGICMFVLYLIACPDL